MIRSEIFFGVCFKSPGDSDYESRILYSSDHGATFQELGSGSQDWRAVSLQFTPKAIYLDTDSPKRQNHIFRWDWNTGHKEILLTVRNPFYYSVQDGKGNLFFSTAVERPAIDGSSMFSELWKIRCDNQPRRLASWPKGELKGYGVIKFAQGAATGVGSIYAHKSAGTSLRSAGSQSTPMRCSLSSVHIHSAGICNCH